MKLSTLVFLFVWINSVKGQCNNNARIRLVGGARNGEGRLEVLGSSGNWGSVCPDGWTAKNAGTTCQELCGDRKYASSLPAKGRFGDLTKPIRIFDTKCVGYETSLLQCPHVDQYWRSCFEDAAVGLCCHSGCDGKNLFLAPRLRYSASCETGKYKVVLQYPGPNPDGVVRPFSLFPSNNPNCWDQTTGANATHNWLIVPFKGDCGVSEDVSNDKMWKFHQKVLIKGQSTGPSISRYYQFLLPVTCGLNRNTNETLWIDTSPPEGSIEDLPGQNGSVSLDMVIKVFNDPDFTVELGTPVRKPVGTPIYVKLAVDKQKLQMNGKAKIIVENCIGIPYSGSKDKHILIKDQSAEDPGTDIFKSPFLHEVRFKMETFKITSNKELYLSCNAYVCPENDNSARCKNPFANAQHTPGASRFTSRATDSNAPPTSGLFSVLSPGYEIEPAPKFKKSPIYTDEDLPGLGPDDEVRIGIDDNKCYLKRENGIISLYHKPKKPTNMKLSGKAAEECLNQ